MFVEFNSVTSILTIYQTQQFEKTSKLFSAWTVRFHWSILLQCHSNEFKLKMFMHRHFRTKKFHLVLTLRKFAFSLYWLCSMILTDPRFHINNLFYSYFHSHSTPFDPSFKIHEMRSLWVASCENTPDGSCKLPCDSQKVRTICIMIISTFLCTAVGLNTRMLFPMCSTSILSEVKWSNIVKPHMICIEPGRTWICNRSWRMPLHIWQYTYM
jgi:hypothetical protein